MSELQDKAKELGIEFKEDTSDEDLEKMIGEAEKNKDDDNVDPEFLKAEAKKAYEKRDTAKKEAIALKNKVKDLESTIAKLGDKPEKEELEELQKELKSLKKFKSEKDKEAEEAELAQKNELEKAEIRFKKEQEKLQKQIDDLKNGFTEEKNKILEEANGYKSQVAKLRQRTLEADIMTSAAKFNAWNPKQISKLLKDDFEYDKDLEQYVKHIYDNKGKLKDELTIGEYVEQFLSDEDNENLVKSKATNTSFNTDKQTQTDTKGKKKSDTSYDVKDDKMKAEAEEHNLPVEKWVEIRKKRDDKLKAINEKRTNAA